MKFYRGCDVTPDDAGMVCRETRWGGLAFALIFGGAFVGSTMFFWYRGIWFFFVVMGLASLVVVPFLLGDVRKRFRSTNWTLWAPPGKLWINLRSYQDGSPLDAQCIIELADSEIAEIRRHEDRYSVSGGGRTTFNKLVSLDIVLRTPDDGTLASLITNCRTTPQPWKSLAGLRSRSNVTLHSVSLPMADVIRIAWTGGRNHAITPGVNRLLRQLESRLHVGEPVLKIERTTDKASDAEVDERILSLVQAGNSIDAIKMLRHERGLSLVEAKQFVEELTARA